MTKRFLQKDVILIIKNISWIEFDNRMEAVFEKRLVNVDDLYFNVDKEFKFGEGCELSDLEALDYLQNLCNMSGQLCVITDYCYERKCGPFVVEASEINEFVGDFYSVYGEAFYSTDIIIINFPEKKIWVLFHEGICWLSRG